MTNPNLAIQQQFVTAVFAGDAETIRAFTRDPLLRSASALSGLFTHAVGTARKTRYSTKPR